MLKKGSVDDIVVINTSYKETVYKKSLVKISSCPEPHCVDSYNCKGIDSINPPAVVESGSETGEENANALETKPEKVQDVTNMGEDTITEEAQYALLMPEINEQ